MKKLIDFSLKTIGGLFILLLFSAFFIFKKVPTVPESEALTQTGVVVGLFESGENDITFVLKDQPTQFYINRGLEKGLNLDTLKTQLMGRKVEIKYPKYWTPLDWNNKHKHLSKLTYQNKTLFNEFE